MLETDKITIHLSAEKDLPAVIKIEKENSEFVEQYDLDRHRKVISDPDELHLSIFSKADNQFVGYIILAGFSGLNESIEFRRIAISKKGLGYGRDALKLTKKLCFENQRKNRLWLDVFEENKRAIGLYESEGFVKEGLLRDCVKQGEKYKSLWIMSILSKEI